MFGPIIATGVVMVTAAVVAANPVMGSSADVQIRSVDLSSGTAETSGQDFLDALAPASPGASGPLSVLKDVVSALVADAVYLGRNGLSQAFTAAGDAAAPGQDLAALSDLAGIRPADPAAPSAPPAGPVQVVAQAPEPGVGGSHATVPPADLLPAQGMGPAYAAHELVSVELPRTLDAVASVVAAVPLAPPVVADTISAVGNRLASLPVAGSQHSYPAGDKSDPVLAGGRVSRTPVADQPPLLSAGPGADDSADSADPVAGGKLSPIHRPWRPGPNPRGPAGRGDSGDGDANSASLPRLRNLGR
ncbi:MAG: hypothetical protein ACKOQ4_16565 [Mycobacterium sp.]